METIKALMPYAKKNINYDINGIIVRNGYLLIGNTRLFARKKVDIDKNFRINGEQVEKLKSFEVFEVISEDKVKIDGVLCLAGEVSEKIQFDSLFSRLEKPKLESISREYFSKEVSNLLNIFKQDVYFDKNRLYQKDFNDRGEFSYEIESEIKHPFSLVFEVYTMLSRLDIDEAYLIEGGFLAFTTFDGFEGIVVAVRESNND